MAKEASVLNDSINVKKAHITDLLHNFCYIDVNCLYFMLIVLIGTPLIKNDVNNTAITLAKKVAIYW